MEKNHEPVLVNEILHLLKTDEFAHSNKKVSFVDGTLGFGGHSKEFIKRGIFVFGIDTDEQTLSFAEENLKKACPGSNKPVGECFKITHGNFRDIDILVKNAHIEHIYGILLDLGVSTPQLTSPERGLSFANREADLDMRLDTTTGVRARDLLNVLDVRQLQSLFGTVLDYKQSLNLSHAIIAKRKEKEFKRVGDLLEILERIIEKREVKSIHPATKAFMALRMAVNTELPNLEEVLPKAFSLLEPEGRLAVISFHSGEDAIVKKFIKDQEEKGTGRRITEKPIVPGEEEIRRNPRSRSAKLRVVERT